MAMISCPECGKEVSDKAAACPNCGFGIGSVKRCAECGEILKPDALSCPKCGCPVSAAPSNTNRSNEKPPRRTAGKRVCLVLSIILFILAGFCLLSVVSSIINNRISVSNITNAAVGLMGMLILAIVFLRLSKK